jgi:hypothetical protein
LRLLPSMTLALSLSTLCLATFGSLQAQAQAGKPAVPPPAAAQPPAAPQVTLTQKSVDSLIAANTDVFAIEAKIPENGTPTAKQDADLDAAAKKGGFATYQEYVDTAEALSAVMDGMDSETKTFVGAPAVLKKQIADVQGDKEMSAKDKKAALDELNETLKTASTVRPPQNDIDLVTKNYDKLSAILEQED